MPTFKKKLKSRDLFLEITKFNVPNQRKFHNLIFFQKGQHTILFTPKVLKHRENMFC